MNHNLDSNFALYSDPNLDLDSYPDPVPDINPDFGFTFHHIAGSVLDWVSSRLSQRNALSHTGNRCTTFKTIIELDPPLEIAVFIYQLIKKVRNSFSTFIRPKPLVKASVY
ncbi:hypothetical protein EVAR_80169_1 [Eumeta japonica]|uniref:Uncharacterized protein n=1 Tax=Eumeta variegata TaxID=151549 RepID=A0A4C1Y7F7_EUMVA|nr:hypothetical protein EVAR_80169_1 [Eumeta japonica]